MRKIKYIRLTKGWSQQQLAEKCGVTQPKISMLENHGTVGKNDGVSYDTLRVIAKVLEYKGHYAEILEVMTEGG